MAKEAFINSHWLNLAKFSDSERAEGQTSVTKYVHSQVVCFGRNNNLVLCHIVVEMRVTKSELE